METLKKLWLKLVEVTAFCIVLIWKTAFGLLKWLLT
jgi:hypothetical protein